LYLLYYLLSFSTQLIRNKQETTPMSDSTPIDIKLLTEEMVKGDKEIFRLLHRRKEIIDILTGIRDRIDNTLGKPAPLEISANEGRIQQLDPPTTHLKSV